MKNILAFDTSGPVLSVAFKKNDEETSEAKVVGFMKHAENLLPMIDELLKKNQVTIQEVDAFLIGRGPGSFTGLRIGFATLKAFLSLQKTPCFGAISVDMIAENIQRPDGSSLAVCLDARREKIYMRLYQRKNNQWKAKKKLQVLRIEEVIESLPDEVTITGDALTKYADHFENVQSTKNIEIVPESYWHPRAATLIHWFENYQKNQKDAWLEPLKEPKDFYPLYFRLTEAEEKRKQHAHS